LACQLTSPRQTASDLVFEKRSNARLSHYEFTTTTSASPTSLTRLPQLGATSLVATSPTDSFSTPFDYV
jgi:hypothetical protein